MGWGSAGQIFDMVADALIDAGTSDQHLGRVCYVLAKALCDQDWDTIDASIGGFEDYPVVVEALRRAGGWWYLDEERDEIMEYDEDVNQWVLMVSGLEQGQAPGTVAGHDELVRLWFGSGPDTPQRRKMMDSYLLVSGS